MKRYLMGSLLFQAGMVLSTPFDLQARQQQTDQESRGAIGKLEFIVGQWEGSGWIMGRDGQRHSFVQTEDVQFKLDTTLILIEGLGKTGGVVTHNALAVISYNREEGNYSFRSYLSTGLGGTFKAELKSDTLFWYPGENMRYVIRINGDGQWEEKGEMNRGGNWFQFMEMTLDRAE